MIVQCPSCEVRYAVEERDLEGVSVTRFRCSRCGVFFERDLTSKSKVSPLRGSESLASSTLRTDSKRSLTKKRVSNGSYVEDSTEVENESETDSGIFSKFSSIFRRAPKVEAEVEEEQATADSEDEENYEGSYVGYSNIRSMSIVFSGIVGLLAICGFSKFYFGSLDAAMMSLNDMVEIVSPSSVSLPPKELLVLSPKVAATQLNNGDKILDIAGTLKNESTSVMYSPMLRVTLYTRNNQPIHTFVSPAANALKSMRNISESNLRELIPLSNTPLSLENAELTANSTMEFRIVAPDSYPEAQAFSVEVIRAGWKD